MIKYIFVNFHVYSLINFLHIYLLIFVIHDFEEIRTFSLCLLTYYIIIILNLSNQIHVFVSCVFRKDMKLINIYYFLFNIIIY